MWKNWSDILRTTPPDDQVLHLAFIRRQACWALGLFEVLQVGDTSLLLETLSADAFAVMSPFGVGIWVMPMFNRGKPF